MFQLYYNKDKCELKIKKCTTLCYGEKHLNQIEELGLSYFNDCYYIAEDRKKLVLMAQSLRSCWIDEVRIKLDKLENMSYPKR